MLIELIPQIEIGGIQRLRVGDVLNRRISEAACDQFRFAVAYMRLSGWDRLAGAIDSLTNRGGRISGVVGVDSGVTTVEALRALSHVSHDSVIFYTTSDFIFHPKVYLASGLRSATVVIGSPNFTRDGLFRNVELATAVHLDFDSAVDLQIYERYDLLFDELLNVARANIQPISDEVLESLVAAGLIASETSGRERDQRTRRGPGARRSRDSGVDRLFPPLRVPVAPPPFRAQLPQPAAAAPLVVPPPTVGNVATFIMQLSPFDSSHRTGVPGTPEVLIPHAAIPFFPDLSLSRRQYPDALFDVLLNTQTGQERHRYRLWYYEERATGTRIDEYRLRMNHDTIDLTTVGGGDLLVISKRPQGADPSYEVTILPRTDPTYPGFLDFCINEVQGKRWGII